MKNNCLHQALRWCAASVLGLVLVACGKSKYPYESVEGDPMGVRIYTLDNGLKVYMAVNHDQPRINVNVVVRASSKHDPADATGLAHYCEHMMLKGTTHYGTLDYEAERPMLDSIEALFEVYRATEDEQARAAIYHQIDSISHEASKLMVPDEYYKMMTAIGEAYPSAYTIEDATWYFEEIAMDQLENWLRIQADRFQNPVPHGFHAELATIYEEYNQESCTDEHRAWLAARALLCPGHPYGRESLGLPQHIKNPSITKYKEFVRTWYVPNNMAIALEGDFDPDEAIAYIDKYFGDMKPNDNLQQPTFPEQPEIAATDTTIYGLDGEFVIFAWHLPRVAHPDCRKLALAAEVLNRISWINAGVGPFCDHSWLGVILYPQNGQPLEELKQVAFDELNKLREGDFTDEVLQSAIQQMGSKDFDALIYSFINGIAWADELNQNEQLCQVTKEELVALAQKYLADDKMITVYKRHSDTPTPGIAKPAITPLAFRSDTVSAFCREILNSKVKPVEPHFLDYSKELSLTQAQSGIPVLYRQNTADSLFTLTYVIDMGTLHDPVLDLTSHYLGSLGTSDQTADQLKERFNSMACEMRLDMSQHRTTITLTGPDENMDEAVALMEKRLAEVEVNKEGYKRMVDGILDWRQGQKSEKFNSFLRLQDYMVYGPHTPDTHLLTADEMRSLKPQEVVDRIHNLLSYKHRILYHGPRKQADVVALLKREHRVPKTLKPVPAAQITEQPVDAPTVYLVDSDGNLNTLFVHCHSGQPFDLHREAVSTVFNRYFGGGDCGNILYTELRTRRSLCYYTPFAKFYTPEWPEGRDYMMCRIETQTAKLTDAMAAFKQLLTDMPRSQSSFDVAKEAALNELRRTPLPTGNDILWSYVKAQDRGLDRNLNQCLYEEIQRLTLQDIVDFQRQSIAGRPLSYGIVGRKADIAPASLAPYGKPQPLTLEELFGY